MLWRGGSRAGKFVCLSGVKSSSELVRGTLVELTKWLLKRKKAGELSKLYTVTRFVTL
jgi:hypothetical protein